MVYREVTMIEIKEILLRAASGYGVRAISKSLGVHRKTIKSYISLATELGAKLDSKDSITDELVGKMRARLSADKNKKPLTPRDEMLLPHREKIEEYLKKGIKGSKIIRLLSREGMC